MIIWPEKETDSKKVVFCIPTITKPYQQCLDSLEASLPLLDKAGWDHALVFEIGCPYISHARSIMLRKALDSLSEGPGRRLQSERVFIRKIMFIDHDLSWDPGDLLTVLETDGDVVAGTYRMKQDKIEYMGALNSNIEGTPRVRDRDQEALDTRPFGEFKGAVHAHSIPGGFLAITTNAVNKFMMEYPHLCYGDRFRPGLDLFNHGAHEWTWYSEDYAFSRNWREKCGEIYLVPNLNISHWNKVLNTDTGIVEDVEYKGNFHLWLGQQEGGSLHQESGHA